MQIAARHESIRQSMRFGDAKLLETLRETYAAIDSDIIRDPSYTIEEDSFEETQGK